MCLKHRCWSVFVAAALGGLVGVTTVVAGEQFIPLLVIREGATRSLQIPRADGMIAYLTLLNARDGGINGVTLVWEECETVFDVPRGIECYERLKARGPTGAAAIPMNSTPLTYALTERARHDQIPLVTVGIGRADAADGRVFPYVFNPPTTYWSMNTAKIRFIGQRAGGMEALKGRKIAHVYTDNDYGRETIPLLDIQAAQYGFTVQHLPVQEPGLDQKATWLRVKVARPDWVILRTGGVNTMTALKEAAQDVVPAGEVARGFICVTFLGTGTDFPVIQEIRNYVYARGKGPGPAGDIGTDRWKRGVVDAVVATEGIRTAMRHFGGPCSPTGSHRTRRWCDPCWRHRRPSMRRRKGSRRAIARRRMAPEPGTKEGVPPHPHSTEHGAAPDCLQPTLRCAPLRLPAAGELGR